MGNNFARRCCCCAVVEDLDVFVPHVQLHKVVVCGDARTGKSALASSLMAVEHAWTSTMGAESEHRYAPTIGVEFATKEYDLGHAHAGRCQRALLQVWDTAGQERFRGITTGYFRGASSLIMLFDVCDRNTFDNVRRVWVPIKEGSCRAGLPTILVGNRPADARAREVEAEEAKALAVELGFAFMETCTTREADGVGERDGGCRRKHHAERLFRHIAVLAALQLCTLPGNAHGNADVSAALRSELAELEAAAEVLVGTVAVPCAEAATKQLGTAAVSCAGAAVEQPAAPLLAAAHVGGGSRSPTCCSTSSTSSDDDHYGTALASRDTLTHT